ncbi:MAG: hypothetical protein OEU92_07650 [Alphaproteobacteria bacterium]|nr:hypothetical protein [Alphaproteobacteria bacterium]
MVGCSAGAIGGAGGRLRGCLRLAGGFLGGDFRGGATLIALP